MAVATYNTDLATFCLCESGDTFFEFTGYALGDNAAIETDWFLQGSSCASDEANGKTGVGHSIGFDFGSTPTFNTGDCFFAWMFCQGPNAVDTYANGGYRILLGSSAGNFNGWAVGGSDVYPNPKGGWKNVVADPTVTADYTTGSPTNERYGGIAFNMVSAISKGRPINADAYRYGRGDLYIEFGQAAAYGTFAGMATANDGSSAHWGLFSDIGLGYLWKGLMSLGTATNAVDFRDSNREITVDDARKVTSSFNAIEIVHASSNVEWTNISIKAFDAAQVSPGSFEMVDNATVVMTTCKFTDLTTFIFDTNATIDGCTFLRCGLITHAGADMSNSIVEGADITANTSAVGYNLAADPDGDMTAMKFTMGANDSHAIEFGLTSPTSITLTDCEFTGYNTTTNDQNDSTFHIKRTTGDVTINITGTGTSAANLTYRTDGANVSIVQTVTVLLTIVDDDEAVVEGAHLYINKPANVWANTADAGNTAGDGDLVVNEAIDSAIPQSSWAFVWRADSPGEHPQGYRFTSWATSTMAFPTSVTGTADTGGSGVLLKRKTGTTFTTADIQVGDTIRNTTDGSWCVVDEITDNDTITCSPLRDGSDNTWSEDDAYSFHDLATTLVDNDDRVDIALGQAKTNASGQVSFSLPASGFDIVIRGRYTEGGTKYDFAETIQNVGGSGLTTTIKIRAQSGITPL